MVPALRAPVLWERASRCPFIRSWGMELLFQPCTSCSWECGFCPDQKSSLLSVLHNSTDKSPEFLFAWTFCQQDSNFWSPCSLMQAIRQMATCIFDNYKKKKKYWHLNYRTSSIRTPRPLPRSIFKLQVPTVWAVIQLSS